MRFYDFIMQKKLSMSNAQHILSFPALHFNCFVKAYFQIKRQHELPGKLILKHMLERLFELEKIAHQHQIPLGKIESGTRTQTDGNILKWQFYLMNY